MVCIHNDTYSARDLECGNVEFMCGWRFIIIVIPQPILNMYTHDVPFFTWGNVLMRIHPHEVSTYVHACHLLHVPYCLSFFLPSHAVWTNCYVINVPGVVIIIALLVFNIVALFVALVLCFKWRLMGMYVCVSQTASNLHVGFMCIHIGTFYVI